MCYVAGIETPVYLPEAVAITRPEVPVCTMEYPRVFQRMHWLMAPPSADSAARLASLKIWLANARIEELETKRLYRPLVEHHRCVARFLWFWEWRHEGKARIRYRISLPHGEPLLIPGLWHTTMVDGQQYNSFTICTMEARGIMRYIHNRGLRQPVVVDTRGAARWLEPRVPLAEVREDMYLLERSRQFLADPPLDPEHLTDLLSGDPQG